MSERTYAVRAVGVEYTCDECQAGVMEPTGVVLASYPPQWPHQCDNCGATKNLWQKYPTIRWERVQAPS